VAGLTDGAQAARFLIRALKARFRDERAELAAISRLLAPTDTVCDIGANKGSFTFWLARWCHEGHVFAFEPQIDIAERLARDCRLFGFSNVRVEPAGVHSSSGTLELSVPRGHGPGASFNAPAAAADTVAVPVRVVALDDYFAGTERIALLKIDVEGAELDVFRGAERILKTSHPLLVFECENRHLRGHCVEDVFRYLGSLGYSGCFVCHGQVRPLSEFDPAVHQRADGDWFWKSKDYCNNFIFAKA
jgi:FkbM family methyltransferase